MPKKKVVGEELEPAPVEVPTVPVKTRKQQLMELYDTLKAEGINSIGDLEVKIAREK